MKMLTKSVGESSENFVNNIIPKIMINILYQNRVEALIDEYTQSLITATLNY